MGGGIGMGNTCKPMAVSFQCMTKITTKKKKKRIHLQCGRPGFGPWVGKIPWRRERLPTTVFWPKEVHGLYPWGHKNLDRTERLSLSLSV